MLAVQAAMTNTFQRSMEIFVQLINLFSQILNYVIKLRYKIIQFVITTQFALARQHEKNISFAAAQHWYSFYNAFNNISKKSWMFIFFCFNGKEQEVDHSYIGFHFIGLASPKKFLIHWEKLMETLASLITYFRFRRTFPMLIGR